MSEQEFYDRAGWLIMMGLHEHRLIECKDELGLHFEIKEAKIAKFNYLSIWWED